MPIYTIQDDKTGRKVKFEWSGDKEPTQQDMEEIFSAAEKQAPKTPIRSQIQTPTQFDLSQAVTGQQESLVPTQTKRSVIPRPTSPLYRGEELAAKSAKVMRPVLETAGGMAGSLVGAGAGLVTGPGAIAAGAAGAGLGYHAGSQAAGLYEKAVGITPWFEEKPQTTTERFKEMAKDVGMGAAMEAGGQLITKVVLGPTIKGGKWAFKALTKRGAEKAGAETFIANTSQGTIFAKNAEEAAMLEAEIPGLKFTAGQRTNDPKMIKFERAQFRSPGEAATMNAEQIANNDDALRTYYNKTFAGKENVDDVIKGLQSRQKQLTAAETAAETATKGRVTGVGEQVPPQETGERIVGALQTGKAATKGQAQALYQQVPETTISVKSEPVKKMFADFDEIAKPMSKFEDPGNVPQVLKRAQQEFKNIGSVSLNDLQGLRSELLAQAKQISSSQVPNERLTSRLYRAAKVVEDAISGVEVGAPELKTANRFFREEYAGVYKQGTVGDILRKGARGEKTKIPLAQIPGKVWNIRNPAAVDDLAKAIGKDETKKILADHAAYDLLQNATDPQGNIAANKLSMWLNKNKILLEKTGLKGEFNKVKLAQEAVEEAKAASREFEKSAAAKFLNADPEKAVANSIKGMNTGKAASDLMGKLKGDQAAIKGLKNAFADHIITSAQTTAKNIEGQSIISNASIQKQMKKYAPAMRILYKDEPEKLKALQRIQKAYEIAYRNKSSPLGGGSDTMENIFAKITNRIPGINQLVAIKKFVDKASKDVIEKTINKAIFDPVYAQKLLEATKKKGGLEIFFREIEKRPAYTTGAIAATTSTLKSD